MPSYNFVIVFNNLLLELSICLFLLDELILDLLLVLGEFGILLSEGLAIVGDSGWV